MKPINSLEFTLHENANLFCSWLNTETVNIDSLPFQMPYGGAIEIQKPELEQYRARTVCRYHAIREITLDSAIKSYSNPEDALDGKAIAFGAAQELTGILTKNVFTFIVFPVNQIGKLKVRAQCWCDCALIGFSHIIKAIAHAYPEARPNIEQHQNRIADEI